MDSAFRSGGENFWCCVVLLPQFAFWSFTLLLLVCGPSRLPISPSAASPSPVTSETWAYMLKSSPEGMQHTWPLFSGVNLMLSLCPGCSKSGPWTSSISSTWDRVRKAESCTPPQTYWVRIHLLIRYQGSIFNAHWSWKRTGLHSVRKTIWKEAEPVTSYLEHVTLKCLCELLSKDWHFALTVCQLFDHFQSKCCLCAIYPPNSLKFHQK